MEKEKWINDVLNSVSGLQKAEPNAFLFEKITARIKQNNAEQKSDYFFIRNKLAIGFTAAALFVVNGFAIASFVSDKDTNNKAGTEIISELSSELGYSLSYNY